MTDSQRQAWYTKLLRLQLEIPSRLSEFVELVREGTEEEIESRLIQAFDCDVEHARQILRFQLDIFTPMRRAKAAAQLDELGAPPEV